MQHPYAAQSQPTSTHHHPSTSYATALDGLATASGFTPLPTVAEAQIRVFGSGRTLTPHHGGEIGGNNFMMGSSGGGQPTTYTTPAPNVPYSQHLDPSTKPLPLSPRQSPGVNVLHQVHRVPDGDGLIDDIGETATRRTRTGEVEEEDGEGLDMTPSARAKVLPWVQTIQDHPTLTQRQSWVDREMAERETIEQEAKMKGEVGGDVGRNSIPSDAMSRGANKPGARGGQGPEQETQPIPFPFGRTGGHGEQGVDGTTPDSIQTGRMASVPPPQLPSQPFSQPPQHPWFPSPLDQFWPGVIGPDGDQMEARYPFPYPMQVDGQHSFVPGDGQNTSQPPMGAMNDFPRPNASFAFGAQVPGSYQWGYQSQSVMMDPPVSSVDPPIQATNGKVTLTRISSMGDDRERLEHERARTMEKLAGGSSVGMGSFGIGLKEVGREKKHKKHGDSSSPRKEKSNSKKDKDKDHHKHRHGSKADEHHHRGHRDDTTTHPTLVHIAEQPIKTSEEMRRMSGDDSLSRSSPFQREPVPQPKRATQQTGTSGPSFGHFGRPFSQGAAIPMFQDVPEADDVPYADDQHDVPIIIMGGTAGAVGLNGLGLGLAGLSGLFAPHRDQRSAYVETIVDEEAPMDPTVNVRSHRNGEHLSSIHENHNLNITHRSPTTSQASVRASKPPSQRQDSVVHTGVRGVSVAPTTLSLVDNMASDSKFHDEALCQLLHAARNMQIGESARQAVRSAAKARVVELARMSERGELRPGAVLPASVNATQSTNDADRRRMDELDHSPPAWSKALFDMLSLTNARLDEMEHHIPIGPKSHTAPSSPPMQDDEAEARTALHNILFPEHPIPMHDARTTFHTATPYPHVITIPVDPGPPAIHVQPPTAENSHIGGPGFQATPRASLKGDLPTTDRDSTTPRAEANQALPTVAPLSFDPLCPPLPYPHPWDVVTQRLFSWALVWMEDDFIRTLESTALGYQVDEFALTIYAMMTFKRNLRHRICAVPPLPCDKLFVPPNMADAINRAVHAKRFQDAEQILTELWYPFGFKSPPRVIVALAKHRNEPDSWAAHRFDLTTARLTTLSFSSQEKSLIDGRPFMWWFAIRSAWPHHNIPHPDHLAQKNQRVITSQEMKNDNSLAAANASRNLLLGWRPDRSTDIPKLRNMVWQEVKRLYNRKLAGKLVVEAGEPIPDDM